MMEILRKVESVNNDNSAKVYHIHDIYVRKYVNPPSEIVFDEGSTIIRDLEVGGTM